MMVSHSRGRIDFFEKIAPYFDLALDLFTLGQYDRFLQKAVEILNPKKGEKILDLCSGTGKAASWIAANVGREGEVVGLDFSKQMIEIAKKRSNGLGNVTFIERDVTQIWDHRGDYDGIFTSFALHELPESTRKGVLEQSYQALKKEGRLVIADFNPRVSGTGRRILSSFLKLFERENLNFLTFNQNEILKQIGFSEIQSFPIFIGMLQITLAQKQE
jgi:demethylphylloquinol methyltransferase